MIQFEYVASGIAHSRLLVNKAYELEKTKEIVNKIISFVNNRNNHKFSVLFNAYAESKFNDMIEACFEKQIESTYSDSGGLQVLTQGKVFTKELKEKVYSIQSAFSDFAMSFDEIPISTIGNNSSVTSKNNKIFDASLFRQYAEKSRDNLKEQIEFFSKTNCRAKILPIIQGNSIEGFMEWHDILMNDLSKEELSFCAEGLSFSNAAFGMGLKEEIHRIIAIEKIKSERCKHIHILGLGSIKRLLPLLILSNNGLLNGIERISFDSTSHTANSSMGTYYLKSMKKHDVGRFQYNKSLTLIIQDIKENFGEIFEELERLFEFPIDEEMLHFTTGVPTLYKESKYKNHEYIHSCFTVLFMASQVLNFTYIIDNCRRSKKFLVNTIGGSTHSLQSLLKNVKCLESFYAWQDFYLEKNISSKKILDISKNIPTDSFF